MDGADPTRCDVVFHGQVQGVGFRFTTTNVAKNFEVTGYVMNLPEGTVRMVAEGDRATVSSLLQSILATMERNVARHEVSWKKATGEFDGFGVRYS